VGVTVDTDGLEWRRRVVAEAGMPPIVREPVGPADQPVVANTPREPAPWCLALIATRNYIPFARVTAQTFLAHHPEFRAVLLLVDGDADDEAGFPEGDIVLLPELRIPNIGWYLTKFTAAEFSNALKPAFLRYLAGFADRVVYLDCDIAVFSRLDEMLDLVEAQPLVLVPHMLAPLPQPQHFWVHPTRADVFNSGLINAGCFALQLGPCATFLDFWHDANFAPGTFYDGAGYQTDQQHLNWALVTMQGATVLRDARFNVAYWNLHERDFRAGEGPDGQTTFLVDGQKLGFFHFSGYDIYDRLHLSRHDGRYSVYNLPFVAEILGWYSDAVLACGNAELLHEPYRFARLANGFSLTPFLRQILKRYEPQIPKFDGSTKRGADGLCAFLMDPLPAAGSMLPLIAAEIYDARRDLQVVFPNAHTDPSPDGFWRWFCRHAGAEFEIQFLVDGFRRALVSDSLAGFTEEVSDKLGDPDLLFLGRDRLPAAEQLRLLDQDEAADTLLEGRTEWYFFTDLMAAILIYTNRPGLQQVYHDILDQDHLAFCAWLTRHAPEEHGCPSTLGERLARCSATLSLARIFSYLSRRTDVARECQHWLLLDDPGPALRTLIRGAGDGLEYDLDDIVLLRFIHQTARHLLVPLYLELPLTRQQQSASRVAENSVAQLPEAVRGQTWAARGCTLHAAQFDPLEARLDEEIRHRSVAAATPARGVVDFLRVAKNGELTIRRLEPAFRAAARQLKPDAADALRAANQRLKEREKTPAVNVFGYFHSDIGIGVSTRGLAKAVAQLRPVNEIPLCTGQIREKTELWQLFQRFDFLSDTNVFVSYPHNSDDLLGMMRPEHISGRQNIAHLAWEQKDGNPWWRPVYDRYDEIWSISDFAAHPFRKMFPNRVRVVPNALEFDEFPACDDAMESRLRGEILRFLFVFDANSSMERKNPEGAIIAFTKAFRGTRHARRVRLTLKVGGLARTEHTVRVDKLRAMAAASGLDIRFDDRQLTRTEMLRYIADADCYLSLHRAEGFGYTMAEAMYYAVPVVASGYSGNLEYMAPDNSYLVPCREAYVKEADGPFQRGSVWGEPDLDAAAALLRHVAEHPEEARNVGERGSATVARTLSIAAVAERIRSRFDQSAPALMPARAQL
jgi:glycosyltransferase involved in cell wall biosynthesis